MYSELNGIRSNTVQLECSGNYKASMKYIKLTITVDTGSSVTVSKDSYSYNKTSNGTAIFYLPETGSWNIKATLNDKETNDTISISAYKDYNLKLNYALPLNDYTWEQISRFSSNGQAPSMFSVGDQKEIEINGTVGDTTFNGLKINAFIIGFNHNASIEGNNKIHFLLGKIEDNLVALIDSMYDTFTDAAGAFTMNTTSTSSGGWESSHMRKTILGSDKAPTSQSGNTLIAAFPAELRAVMKPIVKYSDNKGGGNDTATNVTSTTDYLVPLAEFEVFGERKYANSAEQKYQLQYAYFKSGNKKIFYKHNKTSAACLVWLRSVRCDRSGSFCDIHTGGTAFNASADCSWGLAAAFAA